MTSIDAIPVTTVSRTLVDLAAVLGHERLRRAFEEADRLHLIDRAELGAVLAESNGRRGVGRLRSLFNAQLVPAPRTRSNPEIRFFRLWQQTGLITPEVNVIVEGFEVDFLWRDRRLIVELDGPGYHDNPGRAERDRLKDVKLALAGFAVHRFGTGRVYEAPSQLVSEVRRLLSARVVTEIDLQ